MAKIVAKKTREEKKEKKPETLAYKQSRLQGLVSLIELHQRILFPREQAVEKALKQELQDRTEFVRIRSQSGKLTAEQAQHHDLDIRLDIFQRLIDLLKNGLPSLTREDLIEQNYG